MAIRRGDKLRISLLVFGVALIFLIIVYVSYHFRVKHKSCDANEVIQILQARYHLKFPYEMADIKAGREAKGSFYCFVLAFSTDPNSTNSFLFSLLSDEFEPNIENKRLSILGTEVEPEKIKPLLNYMRDLHTNLDCRKNYGIGRTPKWFYQPITKGKFAVIGLRRIRFDIWLDISNPINYRIYLASFY
jgi:hypothetical protein